MKTLEQWEESNLDLDKFLSPMDEIDETLFNNILCGYMSSKFDNGFIGQGGDAYFEKWGILYYDTVLSINKKYYYLGVTPLLS